MTRLSARDLIGRTYGWFLGEFPTAMRLVWVPAALYAATTFLAFRIQDATLAPDLGRGAAGGGPWLGAFNAVAYALQILLPAIAAGAVLRYLMRGERPRGFAFEVGKTELLIAAAAIVMGLIVFGVVFVGAIAAALAAAPIAMASPLLGAALAAAAVMALALYVVARFVALQPLVVDRGAVAIDVAWRLSKGEARPIAVALVGVYAIPIALTLLFIGGLVLWLAASPEFLSALRAAEAGDQAAVERAILSQSGRLAAPVAAFSGAMVLIAVPLGSAFAAFAYRGLIASPNAASSGPAFGPPPPPPQS